MDILSINNHTRRAVAAAARRRTENGSTSDLIGVCLFSTQPAENRTSDEKPSRTSGLVQSSSGAGQQKCEGSSQYFYTTAGYLSSRVLSAGLAASADSCV